MIGFEREDDAEEFRREFVPNLTTQRRPAESVASVRFLPIADVGVVSDFDPFQTLAWFFEGREPTLMSESGPADLSQKRGDHRKLPS